MSSELMAEILKLSPEERIQLVGHIWDSLSPEQIPPSEAVIKEMERRVALYQANPERGIPWEKVKERAEQELSALSRK